MMKIGFALVLAFLFCGLGSAGYVTPTGCTPFGVRLALGRNFFSEDESQKMSVWFNTRLQCPKSYITVEQSSSIQKIYCQTRRIAFNNYSSFIHRCSINSLKAGEPFEYQASGWSGSASDPAIPFSNTNLKARLIGGSQIIKLIVLADWSYLELKAGKYDRLDVEFQRILAAGDAPDLVYLNGDYAYDLSTNNGVSYENFLIMLSQVSSKLPCILNTGNHEYKTKYDYLLFSESFQLYNLTQNNITVLHLGAFDFVLLDPYGILYENATKGDLLGKFRDVLQRGKGDRPTIVASHYPVACSATAEDCKNNRYTLKQFFQLMIDYNTILYLGAHYHTFQRLYPYTKGPAFLPLPQPYRLTKQSQYLLSVVQGIAGNDKSIVESYKEITNVTAALSYNVTGYGVMRVGGGSLEYRHFTAKGLGEAVDRMDVDYRGLFGDRANLRVQ